MTWPLPWLGWLFVGRRGYRTLGTVVVAARADRKIYSNSYLDKEPPELVAEAGHWLNTGEARTLESLKGNVVWLEFSFIH